MESGNFMNNGKIYKYTNLINGKVYIGQTRQKLELRDKKHLKQLNDNTYFHRALKKYGRNNFSLEVVEDNIPLSQLNEKEKYYINFFESFYTTGKGYNLTQGGTWSSGTQILTITQANEIKNIIQNSSSSFKEIGEHYGVTLYAISDINRGKSFYDSSLKYPLRQSPKKSYIDEDKINIIIDLLLNSTLNQTDIALTVDISPFTVGEINRGKNSWCPKDLEYPLRKPIQKNTYQNILGQKEVQEICYELCFTNNKLEDIGKKYGVAKNTIGDISRGISWKEITHQFKCPIRKNKLENQKVYSSIYGIV